MKPYHRRESELKLTVLSVHQESPGYQSIIFARPPGFAFTAGDWIDLCFDRSATATVKTFSFSSSPNEPDLMISYKEGVSEFKQRLQSLRAGDTINVHQVGNSGFGLRDKYDAVMIAGGIGIAPFRSMLRDVMSQNVLLMYQSKADAFAFRQELDRWASERPAFRIVYVDSTTKGRLKNSMIIDEVGDMSRPMFYIAGPPGMVESTEQFLLHTGVAPDDILDDAFTGY